MHGSAHSRTQSTVSFALSHNLNDFNSNLCFVKGVNIIMKIYARKFISVLLALTMLIGVVPLSAFAEAEPQHLDGASISDEVLNSNVFYIGSTNITMS